LVNALSLGGRDVFAILELRTCIETEAAGLAAQRADARDLENILRALQAIEARAEHGEDASSEDLQFPLQIARTTRTPYLVDVLSQLDPRMSPRANLDPERSLSRVNNEHTDIYAANARGEAEGARAAMRMHLINSRERMRRASSAPRE
jgi:DNA-binding FadR family transcriptional regulator